MILSRLSLKPDDVLRLKIFDVYSTHRLVYNCFPAQNEADKRGNSSSFLYADEGVRKGERSIVMLSEQPPVPPVRGDLRWHEIPESWLDHASYAFKITVNPVRRENASRKIVPVKGRESIARWFCEKAPRWGFAIAEPDCRVDDSGVWQFSKKEQPVTLGYAKISGVLHVAEKELFRRFFREGIGRGKAFGCGFLQLIPVS